MVQGMRAIAHLVVHIRVISAILAVMGVVLDYFRESFHVYFQIKNMEKDR